ncbi:hypothetical protein REPUB_Repub05bG0164800 [Reevesia pubescens]
MRIGSTLFSISRVANILQWCIICLFLSGSFPTPINGITTIRFRGYERDRQALLAIKSQIIDPLGVTSSWNNSVSLCRWRGINCGRKHQRVTKLDLKMQNLGGTLSPYVGNLSFLRFINLEDNNFYGSIPPEIGRLSRLEIFILANNSFGGTIPANLTNCSNLIEFIAIRNKLVGNIPAEIGNLLKLEKLHIAYNHLTGQLPTSLGNVSTLHEIFLSENNLQGRLLDTLGLLKRLVLLRLHSNNFSGLIPHSFCNISSLKRLNVGGNQLYGSLPVNFGSNFPTIELFVVAANNLSGTLPESLSNASKLQAFDVSMNHFSGKVSINYFQKAQNLSWLVMEMNNLGSGDAGDLDFITTLTNCSRLQRFSIVGNQFGGLLPNSITNLSTTLAILYLSKNQITGTIPSGIANLVNVMGIGFAYNRLTGTIPDSLGKLKNLQVLALGGNGLTGRIPTSLGNLSLLNGIGLEKNLLEGRIPAEFGKCQNLGSMTLSSNWLTGPVPKEIFSILTISLNLDLSYNLLTGSFPSEIGNLKTLVRLDISGNEFSGQIPSALSSCTSLQILYLEKNHFYGSIPASLSSLGSIAELDLSNNNLSGQIPEYLEKLSFLIFLNLSNNHFEGKVPRKGVFSNATAIAVIGNDKLCGGIAELHLPSCLLNEPKKQKRSVPLKLILIVCGVLGILLLSSFLFCWLRKRGVKAEPSSAFSLGNSILLVSFQQLFKATNGFASANLIGQGSFGRVYRGILEQNQERNIIAVKVLNLLEQGASKSFVTECKTLRNARHRNLVKIISACSSIDFQGNPFKALIYKFMPNGSLEQWLYAPSETNGIEHGEPKILNFPQRLNVAIDVASALDYLHHHCEVAVVHCDLKPSNILLDHDMVAHVGDFGLARFFPKSLNNSSGNSTSTTLGLKGTVGYAAPEYGIGTEATTSGDMYSFGILMLEMFTGKRPTDDMFKDGLTLHHWAKMALPDPVLEVVDPFLLAGEENASSSRNPRRSHMEETKMKECLISILRVGIACSVESPRDRIDIVDAAKELHFLRDKFLGTGIRTQREARL